MVVIMFAIGCYPPLNSICPNPKHQVVPIVRDNFLVGLEIAELVLKRLEGNYFAILVACLKSVMCASLHV